MTMRSRKTTKKSQPLNHAKRSKRSKPPASPPVKEAAKGFSSADTSSADTGTLSTFMQQFSGELDRLLKDYGISRGSLVPSVPSLAPLVESGLDKLTAMAAPKWSPQIEVFKRKNQLIIRADLPGMTKADVDIDITNDAVVIRGERKSARETDRKTDEAAYYRSERSYGSFYRRIPLAAGASAERATSTFRNGVLEIKIPARVSEVRPTGRKEKPRSRTKTASHTLER